MNPVAAIRAYQAAPIRADGVPGQSLPIPVRELRDLPTVTPGAASAPAGSVQPGSFGGLVSEMIGEVMDKQEASGAALTGLLAGDNVSLHQAMIAMEEASVSFQLMVEVRNKLLESYQELMRMQV